MTPRKVYGLQGRELSVGIVDFPGIRSIIVFLNTARNVGIIHPWLYSRNIDIP